MADAGDLKGDGRPTTPVSARTQAPKSCDLGHTVDSAGQSRGNQDPVELALARALEGATAAGEWSTVAQLARELEARRTARVGVVSIEAERKRRGERS